MAKKRVDIEIRAHDRTKHGMSSARKGFAGFQRSLRTLQYALVGAGGIGLAKRLIDLSAAQERAEVGLTAALKSMGHSAALYGGRLKSLASEMQRQTVYGDEFILGLMTQAINLGISAEATGRATKQAIGLATALKMDLNTALRYTALAHQGEFTMLRRYLPELRATTDATEQLAIVQRVAAAGWQQARAEVETTEGAIKQLKDAMGDLGEMAGKTMAGGVAAAARETKDALPAMADFGQKATHVLGGIAAVVAGMIRERGRHGIVMGPGGVIDVAKAGWAGFGEYRSALSNVPSISSRLRREREQQQFQAEIARKGEAMAGRIGIGEAQEAVWRAEATLRRMQGQARGGADWSMTGPVREQLAIRRIALDALRGQTLQRERGLIQAMYGPSAIAGTGMRSMMGALTGGAGPGTLAQSLAVLASGLTGGGVGGGAIGAMTGAERFLQLPGGGRADPAAETAQTSKRMEKHLGEQTKLDEKRNRLLERSAAGVGKAIGLAIIRI